MSWRWVWPLLDQSFGGLNEPDGYCECAKDVWFIFYMPLGFIIYLIASLAEVNRAPFDMPEAEQELTAGYHVEYSSMKFALFFMAEYIKMIAVSMIGSTLFLGGFQGPWVDEIPWLGTDLLVHQDSHLVVLYDLGAGDPAALPL